jgi:hypothetical protein
MCRKIKYHIYRKPLKSDLTVLPASGRQWIMGMISDRGVEQ